MDIYAIKDYRALYRIGEGHLTHGKEGFNLTGCNGELSYTQSSLASYSVNVDFFWYEIGDVIGIGTGDVLFYCIPRRNMPVAKVRLAAEELYKICRAEKRRQNIDA